MDSGRDPSGSEGIRDRGNPPGATEKLGHHYPFGDRLIDLLRGEPIVPDGPVLSCDPVMLKEPFWALAAS